MIRSLLPLAALLAVPAAAQMAGDPATDPACATVRVAMPREFVGWGAGPTLTVATPRPPVLRIGQAATLRLATFTPMVTTGKAVHHAEPGGVARFDVARPGTYRVALGAGAWIDVLRDGKPVASVAHGHGPACTGIRKIVDFTLARGRYLLVLSGAPAPTIRVMIAKGAA